MSTAQRKRLIGVLSSALIVVAGLAAANSVVRIGAIVVEVFEEPRVMHEYLEGAAWMSLEAWRDGGLTAMYPSSYADRSAPLILTSYPPLFYATWRLAGTLTRSNTYTPGRVVAIIAALGVLVCLFGLSRSAGVSKLPATVFAISFLVPFDVARWIGVARVDIPALSLTVLGLWLYVRLRNDPKRAYLLSSIPFILAGLTKQSMVAAPAAVLFAEVIGGRYSRAAIFGGTTAGGTLAMFLLLNVVTGGGFFDGTVRSLGSEVFLLDGARAAGDFVLGNTLLLMLTLFSIVGWLLRREGESVFPLYVCTSLAMLALTIGKPGSNTNYLVEPMAALCVGGAVGFARLRERGEWYSLATTTVVAASLAWTAVQVTPRLRTFDRYRELMLRDTRPITLPPDPLARPILAPSSLVLLFDPHRKYYLNDDYTFSVLAAWNKLVSPDRIITDLKEHRIGAVVLDENAIDSPLEPRFIGDWERGWHFWSVEPFLAALHESFEPVDLELPLGLRLYLPNDGSVPLRPYDIP